MSVPMLHVPPRAAVVTEHVLLVPLGHCAAHIGLLDAFQRVPVPMKTIDYRPGDKRGALRAHILAGGLHVNELATSAQPVVKD